MRKLAYFAVVAAMLASCGSAPAPTVRDAVVELGATSSAPAMAFFTVHGGSKIDYLVRVDSPGIKTMLHESNTRQGLFGLTAVMGPPPAGSIKIPSNEDVRFEHMGNHVMLYGARGTTVPLTLVFFSGKQVRVEAAVRPVAAAAG